MMLSDPALGLENVTIYFLKDILARKKSLEDEGADRIARALSRERDEGQA